MKKIVKTRRITEKGNSKKGSKKCMKGKRKGEMKEKEETLGVKNVLLKRGKKNIRRKNRRGEEASTFRYARVEAQKLENGKTKERK